MLLYSYVPTNVFTYAVMHTVVIDMRLRMLLYVYVPTSVVKHARLNDKSKRWPSNDKSFKKRRHDNLTAPKSEGKQEEVKVYL